MVKGGPATRRAYFDRVLARTLPARADVPTAYAAALGQRNAAPATRRRGACPTSRRSSHGRTRSWRSRHSSSRRAPGCSRSWRRPLPSARASSGSRRRRSATTRSRRPATALDERLPRDLERGTTGLGPHLDEIRILAGDRDLRTYGSQGEQRMAVLSLLLAESEVLADAGRRAAAPPARRRAVGARRRPPPRPQRPPRRERPDARDGDRRGGPSARSGAAPRRDPGRGASRADGAARRIRAPRVAGRGRSRCGSARRGDARVARRRSGPPSRARRGRSGSRATARCTSPTESSTWAFELGRHGGGDPREAPRRASAMRPLRPCGSHPGPVPSPGADDHEPQPVPSPTPEDDARAASLTSAIDDPALRDAVRRAAAASLSAARDGRGCLIYFTDAAKPLFCRHFSLQEGRDGDRVHRKGHHRSRGPRARPAQARDVHRLNRFTGSPPPGLRGRRQRRRRGARGPQRLRRGAAAPRPFGDGRRPRRGDSRST